jgi:hypothetical protein
MQILMTGASGTIGRSLALRLLRDGHQITALERSVARARAALGAEVAIADYSDATIAARVEAADAVINLAGAPVLGQRWSASWLRVLRDSRVGLTRRLVEAIKRASDRPRVLISSSAIGYYGDRGLGAVDESDPPGDDVLAVLCRDWEAAALEAEDYNVRVAILRIGVVLSHGGGALEAMAKPFRLGVGGRLGTGEQLVSWIHIEDVAEIVAAALTDERYAGPINAVAPAPVRNVELAAAIGAVLGRPSIIPAPAFALRILVGEGAGVLTASTPVIPGRLVDLGHRFQFASLDPALRDCLDAPGPEITAVDGWPDNPYLERRPPRYRLRDRALLDAPVDEVFRFFSAPENLAAITPPSMSFSIESPRPIAMGEGTEIDYRVRLGPIPMRWRTRIRVWEPGARFVDSQERGPYRSWWHQHTFEADGDRTRVADDVYYAPPLGPLGRIANAVFVKRQLSDIFAYRAAAMRFRFGAKKVFETGGP